MKFALTIACLVVLISVNSVLGLTCAANEEEATCTSTCLARCPPSNGLTPRPSVFCRRICLRIPICICKDGFVKARSGKCVLLADCAAEDGLLSIGVVG